MSPVEIERQQDFSDLCDVLRNRFNPGINRDMKKTIAGECMT
jgi:hypothetical protein